MKAIVQDRYRSADVLKLIEADKNRPVIDRTYSLSQVPDAIRHLREGRARRKLVIDARPADDGRSVGSAPAATTA